MIIVSLLEVRGSGIEESFFLYSKLFIAVLSYTGVCFPVHWSVFSI